MSLLRKNNYSAAANELPTEFSIELLKSELLRTKILAWVFAAVTAYVIISFIVAYTQNLTRLESAFPFKIVIFFLTGITLYEAAVNWYLRRQINSGKANNETVWFINAFVEITIPTIMLIFLRQLNGVMPALSSPPVMFYFIFIILSTLRLNIKLSLFVGALASIEYAIIIFLFLQESKVQPLDASVMWLPYYHLQKVILIFMSGIAAAFVAREIKNRTLKSLITKLANAEHARKTEELEKLRKLQLAMLPEKLPLHNDVVLAVFMKTATEVGGDYYDFHLDEAGGLLIAIGDATGHGANAAMMVASTKSLFQTMDYNEDLKKMIYKLSLNLKNLNLAKLYMCLTLVRYKLKRMEIIAAGMPPALIYRSHTKKVEEILLKGLPLGGFPNFPYETQTCILEEGDVLLLMSDGYIEQSNSLEEMLGSSEIKQYFAECAGQRGEDIIKYMMEKGTVWTGGKQPIDDITFVVMKMK